MLIITSIWSLKTERETKNENNKELTFSFLEHRNVGFILFLNFREPKIEN